MCNLSLENFIPYIAQCYSVMSTIWRTCHKSVSHVDLRWWSSICRYMRSHLLIEEKTLRFYRFRFFFYSPLIRYSSCNFRLALHEVWRIDCFWSGTTSAVGCTGRYHDMTDTRAWAHKVMCHFFGKVWKRIWWVSHATICVDGKYFFWKPLFPWWARNITYFSSYLWMGLRCELNFVSHI